LPGGIVGVEEIDKRNYPGWQNNGRAIVQGGKNDRRGIVRDSNKTPYDIDYDIDYFM